jgi:hypothetical protein
MNYYLRYVNELKKNLNRFVNVRGKLINVKLDY